MTYGRSYDDVIMHAMNLKDMPKHEASVLPIERSMSIPDMSYILVAPFSFVSHVCHDHDLALLHWAAPRSPS